MRCYFDPCWEQAHLHGGRAVRWQMGMADGSLFAKDNAKALALTARNAQIDDELMRALEVHAIRDCAEMAARASLYRTESRWGLYHARVDYPERNDAEWLVHAQLKKDDQGRMTSFKRAIEPYIAPIDEAERTAYQTLRIPTDAVPA